MAARRTRRLTTTRRPYAYARDDATVLVDLLEMFAKQGDEGSAIVAMDALLERGFDWAAYDLRQSIANRCSDRRGLVNRIRSEIHNDSTVLEHGTWNFRRGRALTFGPDFRDPPTPYALILERAPVFFRGGTTATSRRREPRLVIWSATSASRRGSSSGCRWSLFGSYPVHEFNNSLSEAERVARADIAYEKLEPDEQRARIARLIDVNDE